MIGVQSWVSHCCCSYRHASIDTIIISYVQVRRLSHFLILYHHGLAYHEGNILISINDVALAKRGTHVFEIKGMRASQQKLFHFAPLHHDIIGNFSSS